MRVLYVVGQGEGGFPHYAAELANAVAAHHEVIVAKPVETDADGMFAPEVEVLEPFRSIGVTLSKLYKREVDPVEFARAVCSYYNLKEVKALDPDVVHDPTGLFPQVSLFARYHGVDEGRPFVVTRHEVPDRRFPLSRPPVLLERGLNALLPDVREDACIVHTRGQRDALVEQGADPESVHVIPHGVYSVFGSHEDVDVDPDERRLLFFGNLIPQKGVDTFVEAAPLVKREFPDVTFVLAGDGKIPERCRSVVDAHPETFEVHDYFIPNDEVMDHFGRATATVLPYREQNGTKGHSGALATAFSFGKPVVATTAGEFPKLVEESGAGTTVPPDDPDRLAAAIVEVLSDADVREEMAANSRRMADRLSWDSIAKRHVELYEDLRRTERAAATERP